MPFLFLREVLGFHLVSKGETEAELTKGGIHFYVENNPALLTYFEFCSRNLSTLADELRKAGCRLNKTEIPEGDSSYLFFTPYGFNFHIWEPKVDAPRIDPGSHLTTELSCSTEKAFCYFTHADKITQWLTQKAEIEPRVGGKYELFWTAGNRKNLGSFKSW